MRKHLFILAPLSYLHVLPAQFGQSKGLADELYEEYEPKPYVSGFSFGGSLLSALPLDIDFANGNFERTLNGEIKRVQWLRISDERYLKEVSSEWEQFLVKARYKKVAIRRRRWPRPLSSSYAGVEPDSMKLTF